MHTSVEAGVRRSALYSSAAKVLTDRPVGRRAACSLPQRPDSRGMRERTAAKAAIPAVQMRPRARQPVPRLNPRRFEICMKAARIVRAEGLRRDVCQRHRRRPSASPRPGSITTSESKESLLFDIVSLGMDWLDEDVVKPASGIADPEDASRADPDQARDADRVQRGLDHDPAGRHPGAEARRAADHRAAEARVRGPRAGHARRAAGRRTAAAARSDGGGARRPRDDRLALAVGQAARITLLRTGRPSDCRHRAGRAIVTASKAAPTLARRWNRVFTPREVTT